MLMFVTVKFWFNLNHLQGSVLYQCFRFSCVVSFESVPYKNVSDSTASQRVVSAQAELFTDGTVELRYGNGSAAIGATFSAGILDDGQSATTPVSFAGCTTQGLCAVRQPFPRLQGLRFSCEFDKSLFFFCCFLTSLEWFWVLLYFRIPIYQIP